MYDLRRTTEALDAPMYDVRRTMYDLGNSRALRGAVAPSGAYVRCTTRTTAPSSCEAAAHVRFTIFDVRFANNAQQSCGRRVDSVDALPRRGENWRRL